MAASTMGYAHPIGVSLGDMVPPEQLGERARELERMGFSHLMIPEDYFYEPALIGATLELAGISRAFPGRFRPGIGLGLPEWLRQMGRMPERPVAALRESLSSIQRL